MTVKGSLSIFLFTLLFCSSLLYAQPHEKNALHEGFIMVTVTTERGNAFYRVMQDDQERPYLNVKDFMEGFLDFTSVYCDATQKHCQGTLQPDKNTFWIDGKQSQYGDSDHGASNEQIPGGAFVVEEGSTNVQKDAFVVQDNSCWLRYDIWEKWLPLTANWDFHTYYLAVLPQFKLLNERKKMREQQIESANITKREREIMNNTEAIKPDDFFRPELKYHASVRQNPQQQIGEDFNYDANLDVFKGTFQTGGPIRHDKDTGWNVVRPYWVYRLKDQKYFYLMEVGDTYFEESNLLLPNVSGKNGFRFDSREMNYGAGSISVNGRAQQNTTVDLYRDGTYIQTIKVGEDGRYVFDNVVVNSSSRLVARLYFPDGSEEYRQIVLSDDNGMILPKGVVQERLFTAETPYGRMNYTALRYGLFNNFSVGVHPMIFAGSKRPSFMADTAIRPIPDTVFLGQALFTGKNIDRAFKVGTTLLYPNYLEVVHRFYSDDTPSFLQQTRILGEYWSGRHSASLGRIQLINAYEQYKGMRDVSSEVIFTYNRFIKPFFSYGLFYPKDFTKYTSIKGGLDIMPTDHSVLEFSRTWSQPTPINTISFFVRNIINVGGWDVGVTYNVPDRIIKNTLTADVTYRITKNLSLGVLSSNKYFGFRINWDGIIAPTPGPATWSDFAMGTLSGKIMSPKNSDTEQYPIENANVTIGSRTATTDKNGYFEVSGIAAYQKLIAKVDQTTLDATVATEKDFDVVYFRPGTQITWVPTLLATAGIDGKIEGLESIPLGTTIEAIKLPENRVMSKGKVEGDGFFIVEKITPGHYQLKVKGLKEEMKTTEIDIPESTNWLSGITWNLKGQQTVGTNKKVAANSVTIKHEVSSKTKYYELENEPLFISKAKGKAKGLDGFISSNRKIPAGLIVEAVRVNDKKVISKSQVIRDGAFILEGLSVGKYELRITGVQNPPPTKQVEIDEGLEWLSGVMIEWEQQ